MINGLWIWCLSAALACPISCGRGVVVESRLAEHQQNSSQLQHQKDANVTREWTFTASEDDGDACPAGTMLPGIAEHRKGPRPSAYSLYIPVTGLSTLAAVVISGPVLWRLGYSGDRAGPGRLLCVRSLEERCVAAAPMVIALTKAVGVLLWPDSWQLLFFITAVYEALAFWCFFQFVSGFVADTWEKVEDRLMKEPPVRIWAVPPFCCVWVFCWPCIVPRSPQRSDLVIVRVLVWQFVIITPLVVAVEGLELVPPWLAKLDVLSLLLGMYGLFALLKMTDNLLHHRNRHSKFWTLKGTIIASTFLLRITSFGAHEGVQLGSMCYTSRMLAAAQAATGTAILTVPLSFLACYAFTDADLSAEHVSLEVEMTPLPVE